MGIEIFSEYVAVEIKVSQIEKFVAKLSGLKKISDSFDLKAQLEKFGFGVEQDGKLLCVNSFDGRVSDECLAFLDALSEFANPGGVIRLKTEYGGIMLMVLGDKKMHVAGDVQAFVPLDTRQARQQIQDRRVVGPESEDYRYWRDALYEVGYLLRLTSHEDAEKKSVSIGRKSGMSLCLMALENSLCPDGIRSSRDGPVTEEERQAFLVQLKETVKLFKRAIRDQQNKKKK